MHSLNIRFRIKEKHLLLVEVQRRLYEDSGAGKTSIKQTRLLVLCQRIIKKEIPYLTVSYLSEFLDVSPTITRASSGCSERTETQRMNDAGGQTLFTKRGTRDREC